MVTTRSTRKPVQALARMKTPGSPGAAYDVSSPQDEDDSEDEDDDDYSDGEEDEVDVNQSFSKTALPKQHLDFQNQSFAHEDPEGNLLHDSDHDDTDNGQYSDDYSDNSDSDQDDDLINVVHTDETCGDAAQVIYPADEWSPNFEVAEKRYAAARAARDAKKDAQRRASAAEKRRDTAHNIIGKIKAALLSAGNLLPSFSSGTKKPSAQDDDEEEQEEEDEQEEETQDAPSDVDDEKHSAKSPQKDEDNESKSADNKTDGGEVSDQDAPKTTVDGSFGTTVIFASLGVFLAAVFVLCGGLDDPAQVPARFAQHIFAAEHAARAALFDALAWYPRCTNYISGVLAWFASFELPSLPEVSVPAVPEVDTSFLQTQLVLDIGVGIAVALLCFALWRPANLAIALIGEKLAARRSASAAAKEQEEKEASEAQAAAGGNDEAEAVHQPSDAQSADQEQEPQVEPEPEPEPEPEAQAEDDGEVDWWSLTVAQLKKELAKRGLSAQGLSRKADFIDKLERFERGDIEADFKQQSPVDKAVKAVKAQWARVTQHVNKEKSIRVFGVLVVLAALIGGGLLLQEHLLQQESSTATPLDVGDAQLQSILDAYFAQMKRYVDEVQTKAAHDHRATLDQELEKLRAQVLRKTLATAREIDQVQASLAKKIAFTTQLNSDQVQRATQQLTTLIDQYKTQLTAVQSQTAKLSSQSTSVGSELDAIRAAIKQLQNKDTSIDVEIGQIRSQLTAQIQVNAQAQAQALEKGESAGKAQPVDSAWLQQVNSRLGVVEANFQALQQSQNVKSVDGESSLSALSSAIDSVQGSLAKGQTDVNDIKASVAKLQNDISSLSAASGTGSSGDSSVSSEAVAGLESKLAAIDSTVSSLEAQSADLLNIKQQVANIDAIQTKHASLAALVHSMQETVASKADGGVQTDIDSLAADIAALKAARLAIGTVCDASELSRDVCRLIDIKLATFQADKTEMVDFALGAAGGLVVDSSESFLPTQGSWLKRLTLQSKPPKTVIESGMDVGSCWPMAGSKGHVSIALRQPILPTHVSLEHISHLIAPDYTTTPKKFKVTGVQQKSSEGAESSSVETLLGEFEYVHGSEQLQTFELVGGAKDETFSFVRIDILSNGGADYTCLYRVRVHGIPAF